jgi:hypothetical protein
MKVTTTLTITARFKDSFAKPRRHEEAMELVARYHCEQCHNRRAGVNAEADADEHGRLTIYIDREVSPTVPVADVADDVREALLPEMVADVEAHPYVAEIVGKVVEPYRAAIEQ